MTRIECPDNIFDVENPAYNAMKAWALDGVKPADASLPPLWTEFDEHCRSVEVAAKVRELAREGGWLAVWEIQNALEMLLHFYNQTRPQPQLAGMSDVQGPTPEEKRMPAGYLIQRKADLLGWMLTSSTLNFEAAALHPGEIVKAADAVARSFKGFYSFAPSAAELKTLEAAAGALRRWAGKLAADTEAAAVETTEPDGAQSVEAEPKFSESMRPGALRNAIEAIERGEKHTRKSLSKLVGRDFSKLICDAREYKENSDALTSLLRSVLSDSE